MFKRSLFIFLSGVFIFSCSNKEKKTAEKANPEASSQINVEVRTIEPRSISEKIEVPGTILAYETTEIHPEVSGRVVQMNVTEGAFVGQGALLAKLYDGDLQAQMRKLEVQLKIAEQTENRQAQLLKIQGISQQEYDMSLLQVHNLKADIDIVKEAIRKTEIRSPFAGKIGLRNISPGAYVTPASIITTISQVNQLKIQFSIPEKYGADIKKGQTIAFAIDGSPKNFTATVIATEVQVEENTRSLAVRASVKERDPVLIPGAFAKVQMVLGKNENALMIPNIAVVPQGRKKQVYLYKAGKAMPADITTGIRDSTNIQVLSGLNAGDTLITSALLFLRPGAEVRILKVNTQGP